MRYKWKCFDRVTVRSLPFVAYCNAWCITPSLVYNPIFGCQIFFCNLPFLPSYSPGKAFCALKCINKILVYNPLVYSPHRRSKKNRITPYIRHYSIFKPVQISEKLRIPWFSGNRSGNHWRMEVFIEVNHIRERCPPETIHHKDIKRNLSEKRFTHIKENLTWTRSLLFLRSS